MQFISTTLLQPTSFDVVQSAVLKSLQKIWPIKPILVICQSMELLIYCSGICNILLSWYVMPIIKCVIAYFIDYICLHFQIVFELVHEKTFVMISLISSNKDTFKQVAITAVWNSNLSMLDLLFRD